MAYTVKTHPCFLSPKRNKGIFNAIRKMESVKYSGVSWSKSMDVPEIPLSYNFTGIKKTVMPKALTIPAIVSIIKLTIFNLRIMQVTPVKIRIYSSIIIKCTILYLKKEGNYNSISISYLSSIRI